ncbi:fructosamine kinase family protein [Tamlana fucoidanivorans]|uniref:Fructosamine kinase family protein n=1 Tax=Allotamlana fucoidanivorans TaxID=2583814 RepID=A0A5C4SNC7_9FLAO|nr:fructosamine kinase family protein [Tamlana fucoidanivorans]TNJ45241.1 fructosamine kinase family protein [Tamlana fucoidanivorans]
MIPNSFKTYLTKHFNENITQISPIHGGDISKAFKIDTATNSYFLKLNNRPDAKALFQAEAYGLNSIAHTNTIKTPEVLVCDRFHNTAFLLLEYINSKPSSGNDFKRLGTQLAQLHGCTSDTFGLKLDNFIGCLPQSNKHYNDWASFYFNERLLPQINLAKQKGLLKNAECPNEKQIETRLKELLKAVRPSLLHGDLWSGNYLISEDGTPYLIDPAIYYGHHEVDIAMTKLFGGFDTSFYNSYHSYFPITPESSDRLEIYLLYYLLVHLNLFGSSYHSAVTSILQKQF